MVLTCYYPPYVRAIAKYSCGAIMQLSERPIEYSERPSLCCGTEPARVQGSLASGR